MVNSCNVTQAMYQICPHIYRITIKHVNTETHQFEEPLWVYRNYFSYDKTKQTNEPVPGRLRSVKYMRKVDAFKRQLGLND